MDEVDWLPAVGLEPGRPTARRRASADRMGEFIATTMELHKLYLERLQEVKDERPEELPAVIGVFGTPALTFPDAMAPAARRRAPGSSTSCSTSVQYARAPTPRPTLGADEVAALYLYTRESAVLPAAQRRAARPRPHRCSRRSSATCGCCSRPGTGCRGHDGSLWRGVRGGPARSVPAGPHRHLVGRVVVHRQTLAWRAASSAAKGKRTLFEVIAGAAVGIRRFSAFTGEDEYLLAPGTRLEVVEVVTEKGGLSTIKLQEVRGDRLVS